MTEKNPLLFIILGATGDLANRKIIPALFDLYSKKLLPEEFKIIGFSRKDLSDDDYRVFSKVSIKNQFKDISEDVFSDFLNKIFYTDGNVNNKEDYEKLAESVKKHESVFTKKSNKIFYLAITPNLYEETFKNLSISGIADQDKRGGVPWSRILVEKPFGTDEKSAEKLDKVLGSLFLEDQIFRVDHYLAKDVIQNILSFRFANSIFEPLWNNNYIEKIEIFLYEKSDVSGRLNFYDDLGAIKDVGQNHILQMINSVIMNDPGGKDNEKIRNARFEALSKISLFSNRIEECAFRAQYEGYLDNDIVKKDSKTETFFRLKFSISDPVWHGVPVYVESGKALSKDLSEIVITFKQKESFVCKIGDVCSYNNVLKFSISPDRKICLTFWKKVGGLDFDIEQKNLSFEYDLSGQIDNSYEKVLYDAIKGDSTLFSTTKEVSTEWRIISEILLKWQNIPLENYSKGINPEDIKKTFK